MTTVLFLKLIGILVFLLLPILLIFYLTKKGNKKPEKRVGNEERERKPIFSGFFKSKETENIRNWIWFFAKIALIWIVAAWFFDWPMNPKIAMKEWAKNTAQRRAGSSTFNSGKCITFAPGETRKIIKLKAGEWSEWVSIPPNTDWRFDSSSQTKVCFSDGVIIEDAPDKFTDFGLRKAIFKFLSQKGGEEIIIISPRS